MNEHLAEREGVPHGNNRYTNDGCRCDECKVEHAWFQAEGVLRRKERLDEVPAERHGILGTYTNWGCRCDLCRGAMREYKRHQKAPALCPHCGRAL